MNITHVVLPTKDNRFAGTYPNGTWSGQLGMITRNECDLAIGPIDPTASRYTVAAPLPPYALQRITPCGGTKRLFRTDMFVIITALDVQVWAALLSTLVFLAVVFSVPASRTKSRLQVFMNHLLDLFGNMMFEASPQPQTASHGRWLASCWWIVVMVVMTGFTGVMKAGVMVKDHTGRISTLQDVVQRPDIKPFVITGTISETILKVRL
ncbi:glutamate receptor ionotropic, delta-2-like isoform X2 [Haemaphysalis longicornis]